MHRHVSPARGGAWSIIALCTLWVACARPEPPDAHNASPMSVGGEAPRGDRREADAACPAQVVDCRPDADGGGCAQVSGPPAQKVSLDSLLVELEDLGRLTRAPAMPYQSLLASSSDRASIGASEGSSAWFANHDWTPLQAAQPVTLLDTTGPGVVTHIWSANPSGTLRVYIDGASTPALEAPMRALLGGEVAPFTAPYATVAAGGYNFYFPIAFSERCVITVSSDARRLYYQVDYRHYTSAVVVESFSDATLAAASCQRQRVQRRLVDLSSGSKTGQADLHFAIALSGGVRWSQRIIAAEGGSVLSELRLVAEALEPRAWRETMLTIEVDGEETVRVPVGDFFGGGPGLAEVQSLPSTVSPRTRTLVAHWPMPFRREARLALEATGSARFAAELSVLSQARTFGDDSLLFHAQWHAPEWLKTEPTSDLHVMTLDGSGFYVGNVLNLINTDASWWGEGDTKLFVDGEAFPSHFGTGTEDDYGYAWCSNAPFTTAFVGQTRAGSQKNFGSVSLYRFRTLDAVAFTKSLRFELEVNHWGTTPLDMEFDAVVYFYSRPNGHTAPVSADPALYRVPENPAAPPADVPVGPYTCGGT